MCILLRDRTKRSQRMLWFFTNPNSYTKISEKNIILLQLNK